MSQSMFIFPKLNSISAVSFEAYCIARLITKASPSLIRKLDCRSNYYRSTSWSNFKSWLKFMSLNVWRWPRVWTWKSSSSEKNQPLFTSILWNCLRPYFQIEVSKSVLTWGFHNGGVFKQLGGAHRNIHGSFVADEKNSYIFLGHYTKNSILPQGKV